MTATLYERFDRGEWPDEIAFDLGVGVAYVTKRLFLTKEQKTKFYRRLLYHYGLTKGYARTVMGDWWFDESVLTEQTPPEIFNRGRLSRKAIDCLYRDWSNGVDQSQYIGRYHRSQRYRIKRIFEYWTLTVKKNAI